MINVLTVDLEPWHASELVVRYVPDQKEDQIEEAVRPILDLLDIYNTRATFFVLGIIAEKYPSIIREIHMKGHEIASHGYSHRTLYELGQSKFEEEIRRSVQLLQSITGERPLCFRAPSFSLNNSTKWALRVLEEHGFKYDASVFPFKTRLYGVPKAPLHPYRPSMDDITKEDPNGEIIEFPMTVFKLGANIPVAGGFYLRLLPLWFLKFAIRRVNETRPAIIYIHPWETYPMTPRLKNISFLSKFVTYYGIGSALRKLEGLLQEFRFQTIRQVIAKSGFPCQAGAPNVNPRFQSGQ